MRQNRAEFLELLVRIAVARHVLDGEEADVPAAVLRLLDEDIAPSVAELGPAGLPFGSSPFRRAACYTEDITASLAEQLPSARTLYDFYSVADGTQRLAASHLRYLEADHLMSYGD